ncbi:6258_t:CDS:2 [Ambispora leptoticha]|uniref:NudC domain-containing protein 1 n=1 Tax=Ambispora leptoticha TaxID=144679 RepID=A0A9N9ADG4_9GLOM|nr:6258_t:CDS:2 [Ambispora leptoticha]
MSIFTSVIKPNRNLLNPKFEGYRLNIFDDEKHLLRVPLPEPGINIPKVPVNANLSYNEMHSLVHYNHLFAGFTADIGNALYFDSELQIILVEYDLIKDSIIMHPLIKLPKSTTISGSVSSSCYPSLRALSATLLLASNGLGNIYLLKISRNVESQVVTAEIIKNINFYGYSEVGDDAAIKKTVITPCVLLDGKIIDEGESAQIYFIVYNVLVSKYSSSSSLSTSSQKTSKKLFDVTLLQMSLDASSSGAEVKHVLRGPDIPLYCALDMKGEGYIIGCTGEYSVLSLNNANISTSEKEQEILEEKQCDENIKKEEETKDESSPPYLWTQTDSDVSINFQLPPGTPKTAVHCSFSKTHLSLTIKLPGNSSESSSSEPSSTSKSPSIPCYAFTNLHDEIDPSASLWTIESKIGLLTLYLEKQNRGTRWMHVFKHDDGVLETLDPNEIAEFRERLEKFTSSSTDGQPFASTLHHPIGHEIEESIDYEGRYVKFFWIEKQGNITAKFAGGSHEFLCPQFECFGRKDIESSINRFPSVCLKYDVDGLVYEFQHSSGFPPITVTHVSTFDAFGFVQASKREKRHLFHDPLNRFIMVLERTHRAFIYWHIEDQTKRDFGKQTIVDIIGESKDEDVLGVQMVADSVILVLLTKTIVVIKLS